MRTIRHLPIHLLFLLPALAEEQAVFDAPLPGAWQIYDPRVLGGLSPSTVDISSGQCHLAAPPPTTMEEYLAAGTARVGVFAPEVFTDCVTSIDITSWLPTTTRDESGIFIGVLTRVAAPVSPGNLNGYSAAVLDMGDNTGPGGVGRNGRLQLLRVQNEASFTQLAGYKDYLLDPTHDYRLVLASRGNTHTARVFDLTNPAAPVAELQAHDSTFPNGVSGFMILSDEIFPVAASFDNFLTWDGAPPPLAIQPGAAPNTIILSSDFQRSLGTLLETTTDLTGLNDPWQPLIPATATHTNGRWTADFPTEGPTRFFRRKVL